MHEIMRHPVQRTIVALGVLLLLAVPTAATAADILVQAEEAIVGGPVARPGYAFAEPREETANWASVNCSPNPGFPNAPGRFSVDFTNLPPGPYRVFGSILRNGHSPGNDPKRTSAPPRAWLARCTMPCDCRTSSSRSAALSEFPWELLAPREIGL